MRVRAAAFGMALLGVVLVIPAAAPLAAQESDNLLSSPLPNFTLQEVLDSLLSADGRLVMGDAEYEVRPDPAAKGGVGISTRPWPGGVVPYILGSSLSDQQRDIVRRGMRRWESVTPVRFVERTNESNWIRIRDGDGNSSCVGMCQGPEQTLRLHSSARFGTVLHELGHALGMDHEHVRGDRDRYVQIFTDNIVANMVYNYSLKETENCSQYDFGSIMHYGSDWLSANGEPTLLPHAEYSSYADLMGNRVDLTENDIQDVRSIYGDVPCGAPPTPTPDRVPVVSEVDINLTGGSGHQRVVFGSDFDVQALRNAWSEGLDFVTGAQGPEGTVLVSARGNTSARQQVTFNTPDVPRDFIRQHWDEDPEYTVSGVFGGAQGWTVIMSRVRNVYTPTYGQAVDNWGWGAQSWRLRESWQPDVIRELWDGGKRITEIAHGPGGWMIVGTADTNWGEQGWDIREDPRERIRERWDAGYTITDITFADGRWHTVATKDVGVTTQRWVRSETFPEAQIRRAWDDGMHVQALDYGGGFWFVVFSQRQ